MPLRIRCPEGCTFKVPVMQAGQQVRCPVCRTVIQIPDLNTAEPQQELVAWRAPMVAEPQEPPSTLKIIDAESNPTQDSTNPASAVIAAQIPNAQQSSPQNMDLEVVSESDEMTATDPSTTPPNPDYSESPELRPAIAEPKAEPASKPIAESTPQSNESPESVTLHDEPLESSGLPSSGAVQGDQKQQKRLPTITHQQHSSHDAFAAPQLSGIASPITPRTHTIDDLTARQVTPNIESPGSLTPEAQTPSPSTSNQEGAHEPLKATRNGTAETESSASLVTQDLSESKPGEAPALNGPPPDDPTSSQVDAQDTSNKDDQLGLEAETEAVSESTDESRPNADLPSTIGATPDISTRSPARRSTPRPYDTVNPAAADTIVGVVAAFDTPTTEETSFAAPSLAMSQIAISTTIPTLELDRSRLAIFEVRRHQAAFETTRRTVSRVIAFLILCLGLANIAIGLVQSGWLVNPSTSELRTWAIVLVLIGGIHAAYAALLAQISDWSTHWVSASFLLVVALISAATAVVLGLSRPDHGLIRWLELPTLLQVQGAIWAVCMVLMSAALAWWCGREAISWRTVVSQLRQREAVNPDAQGTTAEF